MGKISKIAGIAMCFPLLWALSACTDDLFMEEQGTHGVDMNNIVEVEIPFGLGKGITSHVVTRSGKATDQMGKDSQLSGIMVFVYENKGGDASNDKRLSFQLFESPSTSLEGSTGGWIPDTDDQTCGLFKLYIPVGDVYIYLIGNATGSFIDFFPDLGNNKLETREDFINNITPKWSGNMYTVDGFLPLFGTVNNNTGACRVEEGQDGKGIITYKNEGTEYTISQEPGIEATEVNSFVLKRLMCKVSMEFKSGEGVKFTPKTYRFCHCGQFIAPIEEAWQWQNLLNTIDTETVTFDAQTPNSFTVYLPENIREYLPVDGKDNLEFSDRDRVKKDADGNNVYEDMNHEGHEGHYDFQYAPKHATYVEVTGKFEGDDISADTKYILHLGDFRDGKFNEFSLKRDYHYQYTVTVKGVNEIVAEVTGEPGGTPDEKNPSVEGIVFEGGARLQLDAHYEQVEMKLKKTDLEHGVYIYAQTPFGMVNCKYLPASGALDESHANTPGNLETIKRLLQWIEFKKQEQGKGVLATYKTGEMMDVFMALNEAYANTGDNYYTCFVDEYYYTSDPINDKRNVALNEFINADDRTFSLGSSIKYSQDGQSAVASAVYVLQQHAIACFYDLNNTSVAKYGVETVDEIGDLVGSLSYGSPSENVNEEKKGRENTWSEITGNTDAVNWTKNGFLLSDDGQTFVPGKERLKTTSAHLACLTRNRDFDGNGYIDKNELRWYTPARDQVLGLWIGEPSLPTKAALYPQSTVGLVQPASGSVYPIFTSTAGNSRVIYAEQGSSFGDENSAPNGGYIRAVRNLGATPSPNSYATDAEPYYHYDTESRTIEVYLTSNALRAFSNRELASHHERSVVNRPYRKFQVALQPYVKSVTAECEGHRFVGPDTQTYDQLQTTDAEHAKGDVTTIAANYPGAGEADISTAAWRLPNQREMALMIVAMGTDMGYNMENYHHTDYVCSGSYFNHSWKFRNDNYILHCRTSFSSKTYTPYGYMYNTRDKQMQLIWTSGDDNAQSLGMGTTGIAGYLCVRDVRE